MSLKKMMLGKVKAIDKEKLNKLASDIAKRNNLGKLIKGKNLTWHSMFTETECPGAYLLSKLDYICDEANKINSETPKDNTINVFARGYTKEDGWLPEVKNNNDYVGYKNHALRYLAIGTNIGYLKYRITTITGKVLPWVTGYNINDLVNGCAGNGEPIATVEVYFYTPDSIRPYKKAKYKVNDYDWQYDTETSNGQDGYAGVKGVVATKFEIVIE